MKKFIFTLMGLFANDLIHKEILSMSNTTNATLPMKIDEITTLIFTRVSGKAFEYGYVFSLENFEKLDKKELIDTMERNLIDSTCSVGKIFFDLGYDVKYSYYKKDFKKFHTFELTKNKCSKR